MDNLSGDISQVVLKRVVREEMDKFVFDGKMLSVFTAVDGKKHLSEIAENLSISLAEMRVTVGKLMKLKLVQAVQSTQQILDKDFFKHLRVEMSLAVGPIAEILIEDAVVDLGGDISRFPITRAAELVDLLAREIRRDEKRALFKRNMVTLIRGKGYLNI